MTATATTYVVSGQYSTPRAFADYAWKSFQALGKKRAWLEFTATAQLDELSKKRGDAPESRAFAGRIVETQNSSNDGILESLTIRTTEGTYVLIQLATESVRVLP